MRINEDDCRRQLESLGLILPAGPLDLARSGTHSQRCLVEGGGREKRGWYRLSEWVAREGVFLIGTFGVWEGDNPNMHKVELTKPCESCGHEAPLKAKVCPACGHKAFKPRELSAEERAAMAERAKEDRRREAAQRAAEIRRASEWASAVWRTARPADLADHDYFSRKGITDPCGARILESIDSIRLDGADREDLDYLAQFVGALVLPFNDLAGRVYGLQFILSRERHAERIRRTGRDKEFWPRGMGKEGRFFVIGSSAAQGALIAEGFATAATLRMATGQTVVVAYDAGNVPKVVSELAKSYKRARLLACADDDWLQKCRACGSYTPVETDTCAHCGKVHGKGNAGVSRANEAALAVDRCSVVVPQFSEARPADRKGPTDFNDLAAREGLAVVRAQVERAMLAHGWNAMPAESPAPRGANSHGGGGGNDGERPGAVSHLTLDEIAARFVYVDDDTGDFAFDHWTRQVVRLAKVVKLLPPRVRFDDLKEHPTWRGRAVYIDQIGFDPGNDDANIVCNRFTGWPMQPRAGRCDHVLDLLRHLCALEDDPGAVYDWILKWLAYPLQHPGAKMATALVIHGPQGVGKNLVFEGVARIYGDYGIVINQAALEDKFNADWTERKLFVLADEVVSRGELHHLKNQLKGLITGEWVRINPKNVAARRERNHMNIVFCSNEAQPVVLENDDRRHLVLWTPPKLSPEFYTAVAQELDDGGVAALYHYLLNVELGAFTRWTLPPMTRAKAELIEIGLGSAERFIHEWRHGELEIPFCPASRTDVYSAYLGWCRVNGEKFPRPSAHFFGTVRKLEGWYEGFKDVFKSSGGLERKRLRMIVPAHAEIEALQLRDPVLDHRKPEGWNDTRWLTESAAAFADAIREGARP